jgi:putative FmdB family regulatory protein
MPIYEFLCNKCGEIEDKLVSMETIQIKCTKCGGAADKIMSAPSFILKGGGWSSDNYAKSSRPSSKKKEKTND